MKSDERELRVGLALAALGPCLTCGTRPVRWTAVFIPADETHQTYGARYFYALCSACRWRDDKVDAAEAALEVRS